VIFYIPQRANQLGRSAKALKSMSRPGNPNEELARRHCSVSEPEQVRRDLFALFFMTVLQLLAMVRADYIQKGLAAHYCRGERYK
jgi:hypothetical protein